MANSSSCPLSLLCFFFSLFPFVLFPFSKFQLSWEKRLLSCLKALWRR